ncbi:hypothetical protein PBY51_023693 [Eleginops maclovinus]|uniref:Interleukin-1 beta n=1 Tax=Eleginops maclovinus TaxID=56733 RepID=A0AAN7X3H5_ELEMC|nr:hypothetical protein PBY51_023693 [Eleginops maclovinus]
MSNFDLSEALDSPHDLKDQGVEHCCFNMTDVQDEIFRIDEGLDLVVSRNPKNLRHFANLVLASNRKRKSLKHCGRGLSEEKLCSAIMDCLVTETTINMIHSPSTQVKTIFQRLHSATECTLCDHEQKNVVCGSDELKLQAITLQGGHGERKVNFQMYKYITACASDGEGLTVCLSISRDLHMSCSMEGDTVTLLLERCDEGDLKRISGDADMDRFLFFKRTVGVSLNSFESVKYRTWFISTSVKEENKPLEMCQQDTHTRLTCFKVNN